MSPIQTLVDWLRPAVNQPLSELSVWQRRARTLVDLGRFGAKHLAEDNAPQMAAALAYRTLFGLLPVLVVAMVTAKAFLGDRLPDIIAWLVTAAGVDRMSMTSPSGESVPLGTWLESIAAEAGRMNLSALGWVGAAVVVYSAISLMVTIENSFNSICRAPNGRSWLKRVPMYWFVLTVGPIVVGFTPVLDARLASAVDSVAQWQTLSALALRSTGFGELAMVLVAVWHWAAALGQLAWSVSLLWLFMFAMYMLVPNAGVGARSALIGSLVAAVLLEMGKRFLGAYLSNAFSVSRLYGSLGLVPLFMLWVYVMWMVVLFGLEVAALVHTVGGRGLDNLRTSELERSLQRGTLVDPASVLVVMEEVVAAFRRGEVSTLGGVTERTGLDPIAVQRMVERLIQRGFLHRVEAPREGVALAQPPDGISAEALIQVGFELAEARDSPRFGVVQRLRQVQREFAHGRSLESLLVSPVPAPPPIEALES
ncbi:MAG: YihY family inner membrane protein [Phycisphaerales bacterium]|nr:YihY family inner membrane protein [Phycisphaerales bacterium]